MVEAFCILLRHPDSVILNEVKDLSLRVPMGRSNLPLNFVMRDFLLDIF
jgi:hypothetical protein